MKIKTFNDLIAWNTSNRTIALKIIYIDICKVYNNKNELIKDCDIISGLLLSQVIFWHLPSKDGYSKLRVEKNGRWWIAKRRTDWKKEIRISERQYDRAIKILSKDGLGIVDVEIYKFAGVPMPHIALNYNVLFDLLNKQIAKYAKLGNDIVYKKPKNTRKPKSEPKELPYRSFKHLSLSQNEFNKLNKKYSKRAIDETLDDIENYKKNTNYISLYLTANKWLRKTNVAVNNREGYSYDN